jgi:hypothetical protein
MENLPAPVQLKQLTLREGVLRKDSFAAESQPVSGGARSRRPAQSNVFSQQQRRLRAIASGGQAILRNCVIFRVLGCSSPLALSDKSSQQHDESRIWRVHSIRLAPEWRFADVNLNYWDEALAYIAIAVFLDYFEAR